MMLLKIIGIALMTAVCALAIKPYKAEYAFVLSIGGSAVCLFVALSYLSEYFSVVKGLFADSNVSFEYFGVALEALGIGYLSEFAADTARDSGQTALASKIIFAGRVSIFVLALPLIKNLLSMAVKLVE